MLSTARTAPVGIIYRLCQCPQVPLAEVAGSVSFFLEQFSEGDFLVLRDVRGTGLRWDYDLVNNTFVLGPMDEDGALRQILRKYRRIEE